MLWKTLSVVTITPEADPVLLHELPKIDSLQPLKVSLIVPVLVLVYVPEPVFVEQVTVKLPVVDKTLTKPWLVNLPQTLPFTPDSSQCTSGSPADATDGSANMAALTAARASSIIFLVMLYLSFAGQKDFPGLFQPE